METTLWELFCETGDPMGYLLYREEKRTETGNREEQCADGEEPAPRT